MHHGGENVLFVHAHPDDESISTGGTIATLIDRGAIVTVLTCTRGELGEVVAPDLRERISTPAELGEAREIEIAEAMTVLGVTDHRFLGSAGARWDGNDFRSYLDSGMRWGTTGAEALAATATDSLTAAPLGEVAADIAAVIAEVDPGAVVSYNERGGYGHPDHIRTHQAARRAAEVMGVPFYVIEPRQSTAEATVSVDVSGVLLRKRKAIAAYRSQLVVDGESFSGANGVPEAIERIESFRRISAEAEESVDNSFQAQSLSVKIFTIIVALLIGSVAGLVLTAVHQSTLTIGTVVVPWAVVVGLLAMGSLLAGLRIVFDSRIVPIVASVGAVALTLVLSSPNAGGSVVVPANVAGYVWTYGLPFVIFLVLAWPKFQRRRAR